MFSLLYAWICFGYWRRYESRGPEHLTVSTQHLICDCDQLSVGLRFHCGLQQNAERFLLAPGPKFLTQQNVKQCRASASAGVTMKYQTIRCVSEGTRV
jgi:hypothetical protein